MEDPKTCIIIILLCVIIFYFGVILGVRIIHVQAIEHGVAREFGESKTFEWNQKK